MTSAHGDPKPAIVARLPSDVHHVLARPDIEPVILRYPAIINEAVPPVGLLMAGNERHLADLDPFRGREEGHAERIPLDGGHDGAAVQQDTRFPSPFRGHPDGEPAG